MSGSAGIAGANAFHAGNTAFRLGMGKILVPFVFAFAPSLLLVTEGFTWTEFGLAFFGAVTGILALAGAVSGWMAGPVPGWQKPLLVIAALFVLGRSAIAWYLDHATTGTAYGAMGALALMMLWVYYAAIILFAGAVVTATVDERRGTLPRKA